MIKESEKILESRSGFTVQGCNFENRLKELRKRGDSGVRRIQRGERVNESHDDPTTIIATRSCYHIHLRVVLLSVAISERRVGAGMLL